MHFELNVTIKELCSKKMYTTGEFQQMRLSYMGRGQGGDALGTNENGV
jgi:hypothetical protein